MTSPILDANNLYDGFKAARRGSDWKAQVQAFGLNWLTEIFRLIDELEAGTYDLAPVKPFILNERGHTRLITGNHIRDRVVIHTLCDKALIPALDPYLIHDNGASRKGKGITFTRNQLVKHLRQYYSTHGSNDGYILLTDFSKYYDNIEHDKALQAINHIVTDELAMHLLTRILHHSEIDVSYMTDEEYQDAIHRKYNAIEHLNIDNKLLTKEKMLRKSVNIGDQTSQVIGIFYPTPIDNYIKTVRRCKYYGRYMDDLYIISDSKDELLSIMDDIREEAAKLGIFINERKARIAKLSKPFRYLQIQYALSDSGRIMQKINPKRITAMKRKLKKLRTKLDNSELTFEDIDNTYRSWYKAHHKYMSYLQRKTLDNLYNELYEDHRRAANELHDNTGGRNRTERCKSQWKQLHQHYERDRGCIDTRQPYIGHDLRRGYYRVP